MSGLLRLFLVFLLMPLATRGQVTASDNAANYGSGWSSGENLGSGFSAWLLQDNNNAPGSSDFSGFFIYTSGVAAVDTGNDSFGLYANGPDYNEAVAYRGLRTALTTGQIFSVKFKNNAVATGGAAGISLLPNNRAASTNTMAGISSAACLSFYFLGGGNDYLISDGNGTTDTGIPFNEDGLTIAVLPLSNTNYSLMIKSADGSNVYATFPNQPFRTTGPINGFAAYALNTGSGGNVFFNQLEVSSAAAIPPVIENVSPANGSGFINPSETGISFEVTSLFAGVATNGITLQINGETQSNGLSFSGGATNWYVTPTIPLPSNATYSVVITVIDRQGNTVSQNFAFNTWSQNLPVIEAEDYNFYGGGFIADPVVDEYGGAQDGLGALSTNAIALAAVDFFTLRAPDGGTNVYRPQDSGSIDVEINSDFLRPIYAEQDLTDYSLALLQTNEWEDYTRVFDNITSQVYARMAAISGTPTLLLERLAAPTTTNSIQSRIAQGNFLCSTNTGGAESYVDVPLTDFFGNPVLLQLTGTNTLRATCLAGSYHFNYLALVPSTNTAPLLPYIATGYPSPGETNVAENVTITFTIANRTNFVQPATIRVLLNGAEVTDALGLSNNSAGTTVSYFVTPLLQGDSTNQVVAIFSDGATWQTNQWQFTVANLPRAVELTDPMRQGTAFSFGFQTQGGRQQTVEFNNALANGAWQTLTNLSGSGAPTTVTDPGATNGARFYRVVTH